MAYIGIAYLFLCVSDTKSLQNDQIGIFLGSKKTRSTENRKFWHYLFVSGRKSSINADLALKKSKLTNLAPLSTGLTRPKNKRVFYYMFLLSENSKIEQKKVINHNKMDVHLQRHIRPTSSRAEKYRVTVDFFSYSHFSNITSKMRENAVWSEVSFHPSQKSR